MDTNSLTICFILLITAYFFGSIPFGLILVRWSVGKDLRQWGSGNIGATNACRVAGIGWGVAVLIGDILKGAIPTLVAVYLSGNSLCPAITALAAICGHIFPAYLGLKPSGKGVASALGAFFVLTPWACAIAFLTFIIAVILTRRISAGSLCAALILPLAIWMTTADLIITSSGLLTMALIIARHHQNIQRLIRGQEPPWNNN